MINQNLEINEENSFNSLLECQYCGEFFSKNNKPLILKCTHNICQTCHGLNKNKLKCLICHSNFEGKENKRHPINFLLLEIIERSIRKDSDEKKEKKLPVHKNKFKKTKSQKALNVSSHHKEIDHEVYDFFHCIKCDLNFPNKFHFDKFLDHKFTEERKKTISEEKWRLGEKSQDLMTKYKNFNERLEKSNEDFFDFLNERMKVSIDDVVSDLKDNNLLDNLLIFGLINKGDKEKLNEFVTKYLYDQNIVDSISKSKSFDEFLFNLKKVKDLKINNFISSYFFLQDILGKKLKIDLKSKNIEYVEEKIGIFISKLDAFNRNDPSSVPDDIKSLFKHFSQDLNVEAYDCLDLEKDICKKFKIPAIVNKQHDLIFLDTLTEELKTFYKINTLFPNNLQGSIEYSYFLDSDYTIYITGGKINTTEDSKINSCFFSFNFLTNSCKIFKNLPDPVYNHSSILINNKLFIIGGKTDNNIPLKSSYKYNLVENNWSKIQNCPYEFKKKPFLLNFENEYIYVFEDLKHFFYYEIKADSWTTCDPTYKDEYNLNLENFVAIYLNGNIIILGGSFKNDNGVYAENYNIYNLKDLGCIISKKAEFKMINNSSIIDHGYLMDHNYLLEFNEKENRVKIYKTKELSNLKWDLLNECLPK